MVCMRDSHSNRKNQRRTSCVFQGFTVSAPLMTLALLMNSLTMTNPSPLPPVTGDMNASGTKSMARFRARVNSMGYRLRPSLMKTKNIL